MMPLQQDRGLHKKSKETNRRLVGRPSPMVEPTERASERATTALRLTYTSHKAGGRPKTDWTIGQKPPLSLTFRNHNLRHLHPHRSFSDPSMWQTRGVIIAAGNERMKSFTRRHIVFSTTHELSQPTSRRIDSRDADRVSRRGRPIKTGAERALTAYAKIHAAFGIKRI